MILGTFGVWQLFAVFILPVGIFLAGFFIGKNAGYVKRVKETEKLNK